jgi:hypothetical protein
LQEFWRIFFVDGVNFNVCRGDQADLTVILTAFGVDLNSNKKVLAPAGLCRGEQRWLDE